MPIDLSVRPGNTFPSPEQMMTVFEKGLLGTDITNGIPQPKQQQMDPEVQQRLEEMSRVYEMVQKGELVPKQTTLFNNTQPTQQQQYSPIEKPVNNNVNQADDWLAQLGLATPTKQEQAQPVVQQNEQIPQQNTIQWDDAIKEQVNGLYQASAKRGINGEEVLSFMQSLSNDDYVEMFKAWKEQQIQQQPVQPQQYQAQPQRQSINWNQPQNSYGNTIADMSSAPAQSYAGNQERKLNPFGLDPDQFKGKY